MAGRESQFEFQIRMLDALCPPVLGFGVGGSYGAGRADENSDLDFFLLVPDRELFGFIRAFPDLIQHQTPPVATQERGFWPDFGYAFAYVYENTPPIDYFINSPSSLRPTPMARKTRVIRDTTGEFTGYQRMIAALCADPLAGARYLTEARTEILIELRKISKLLRRQDTIAILHRLDRLRRVYLALVRQRRELEPYVPHDADRGVLAALGPEVYGAVAETFPRAREAEVASALSRLLELLDRELALLEEGVAHGSAEGRLCDVLALAVAEVRASAQRGGT